MGLIESDWGGTPAQSWTSKETLQSDPALKFILDDWDRAVANYPAAKQQYDQRLEAWNQAAAKAKAAAPVRAESMSAFFMYALLPKRTRQVSGGLLPRVAQMAPAVRRAHVRVVLTIY